MQDLIHKQYLNEYRTKYHLAESTISSLKTLFIKLNQDIENKEFGKEQQEKQTFLDKLFVLLGYEHRNSYYFEVKTTVGQKEMDGTLGVKPINGESAEVAIEWKGTDTKDLDRETKSNKSAVTQLFDYMSRTNATFGIVSNFNEFRLYHYNSRQQKYSKFLLEDLAKNNDNCLEHFYFIFHKKYLLKNEQPQSVTELFVSKSTTIQDQISEKFYKQYAEARINLLKHIQEKNPNIEIEILLEKSQKILDRLIFIFFCEDSADLLPKSITKITYDIAKKSRSRSNQKIWIEFKILFEDIDKGRMEETLKINQYNGGLFAEDDILDNIIVEDKIWVDLVKLSEYDFRSDLNVNILGHIFEQSISDLEKLKRELKGEIVEKTNKKRKDDGIFYTPEFITRFIVKECIDEYLKNGGELEKLTLLDPACGSGAFLNQAFDVIKEYSDLQRKDDLLSIDEDKIKVSKILNNNLYGVDLQPESIELSKLSLWLKSARSDSMLENLDSNLKQGESLIDFNWNDEFKAITDNGGFDIIIGNPPYVRHEIINSNTKNELKSKFDIVGTTSADLYVYFFEQSLRLVKDNGMIGFIVPNKWMEREYGTQLRNYLKEFKILKIVNFGELRVFEDASVEACIIILKKTISQSNFEYSQIKKLKLFEAQEIQYKTITKESLNQKKWSFTVENLKFDDEKYLTLKQYTKSGLLYGVKTGNNKVFRISKILRDQLVSEDPKSAEIIKPVLETEDFEKWNLNEPNQFLITSGYDTDIEALYPAVFNYFTKFEPELTKRSDKGKKYYNLRACDYYDDFAKPKLIFTHTATRPKFYFDIDNYFVTANSYIITNADKYLQAILNSNAFFNQRSQYFPSFGDLEESGRVRLDANKMEDFPIPIVNENQKKEIILLVDKITNSSSAKKAKVNLFVKYIKDTYSLADLDPKLIKNFEIYKWSDIQKLILLTNKTLGNKEKLDIFSLYELLALDLIKLNDKINSTETELNIIIDKLYGI